MKFTEKEYASLIVTAVWKQNDEELLILVHKKGTYYLGVRKLKIKDGLTCHSYPTPELAQKAFLSTVMKINPLPEGTSIPDLFRSQITLDEATAGFKKTLNGTGYATCPCCEDMHRIYQNKIRVSGIMILALMVHKKVQWKEGKVDTSIPIPYTHIDSIPQELMKSRTVSQLVHWGLVESAKNDNSMQKTSGLWRPTIPGCNFVRGIFPVREYVVIYKNKFQRFEGGLLFFNEIVDPHDYSRMMDNLGGIHKELNDV